MMLPTYQAAGSKLQATEKEDRGETLRSSFFLHLGPCPLDPVLCPHIHNESPPDLPGEEIGGILRKVVQCNE
jgi:hypothetical protein